MALYPYELDRIRRWVKDFDDMVAEDLNDLFEVAIALETELGIEPSGSFGTIEARLFALGNISTIDGKFRRLQWFIQSNLSGNLFDDQGKGLLWTYQAQRFRNRETIFGTDVPGVFLALQGPLSTSVGTGGYGGVPWAVSAYKIKEGYVGVYGTDGYGTSAAKGRLSSSNTANGVSVGVLAWNLF